MMKQKILLQLLFVLTITPLIFGSATALQFEIVPFNYTDDNMREQLCAMVDNDQALADLLHFTSEDSMRNYLSAPDLEFKTQLLICKSLDESSTIFGFIMCSMHEIFMQFQSVGVVNSIAVAQQYRGQGIAQALLNAFETLCREHGIEQLLLYVAKNNDKAIRSYQWNGFSIAEDFIDQTNDEIPMIKSLQ